MLGRFDAAGLHEAMTAVRNRYGQLMSEEALRQIAVRMERLVNDPSFIRLLEGASLRKEQPLYYRGEMKQIDLLLEYDDHLLVVDYKSSRKFHIKHLEQVRGYMAAVSSITGKRTEGMLLYLLEEEIRIENLK